MKINRSGIFLTTGTVLYSVVLTPLFTATWTWARAFPMPGDYVDLRAESDVLA